MVIFYYPAHFNRGVMITHNEFITPFIDTLTRAAIPYKIVEEPDLKIKYARDQSAIRFDFWFVLFIVIKKLIPFRLFSNPEAREQWLGKLFRYLTFNYFKADVVFTLSNSMGGFWRGYNPTARIIDYQHGAIDQKQVGFFENNEASEHIVYNKKEVAVWGENFKKFFENVGGYYKNKVHVLGYFKLTSDFKFPVKYNAIIFSLQFLPEFGEQLNQEMYDKLEEVLVDLNSLPELHRPKVILRNHPRHQNAVSLAQLIEKFDFVSLMETNSILSPTNYSMHITYFSTVAFEMAIEGIPSYFLVTENLKQGQTVFIEGYNYPIVQSPSFKDQWLEYCLTNEKWMNDCHKVKQWGNKFFEKFNSDLLLSIVNGKV
jgi:hypothetical protein